MLKCFENESFDIIIQAGQSNSDGTGFGEATCPFVPKDSIWYLNGDFIITPAAELVSGNLIQGNYSLSFADEYIGKGFLKEGRKILILRASVGGTGFLDHRWGLNDDLFLRMMIMINTALSLNKDNRLVAFLWHQGETDATLNASYEVHAANLTGLINAVKEGINCPRLPFIAGDFTDHWKSDNEEICRPVIKAIKDVFLGTARGKFVETSGLKSNDQDYECGDTIHFSREALYTLGKRYFAAFESIVKS